MKITFYDGQEAECDALRTDENHGTVSLIGGDMVDDNNSGFKIEVAEGVVYDFPDYKTPIISADDNVVVYAHDAYTDLAALDNTPNEAEGEDVTDALDPVVEKIMADMEYIAMAAGIDLESEG